MSEKEKMLGGEMYYAEVEELRIERFYAKELCHQYNNLPPSESVRKKEIIKQLLGKTEEHFVIEPSFYCDYGYNIEIGENFYVNHNCVILDCAKVIFGNNVFIGPNCGFYTAGHPLDYKTRNTGLEFAKPITVKDNVWFGGNVCVMPGVTIGENTVIGAGSIVTKDIPANVVAAGNPCKVIREIKEEM